MMAAELRPTRPWLRPIVLAVGLAGGAGAAMAQTEPATLKLALNQLAGQRVFFGHQSVGDNLLAGIQELAKEAQVTLPVVRVDSAADMKQAGLAHAYVAENTQPLKKLQSFERALATKAPGLQLAALKFCYVDVHAGTDVKQLFARYQASMATVQTQQPGLRLVHFTVPLTTVQTGWKASLKRLLGKAPHGILDNLKREEYNQLVRQSYGQTGLLFDLARVEQTRPDGSAHTVEWQGRQVPALYPGYSNDGEHLNTLGQRHAARTLVEVLAKASPP